VCDLLGIAVTKYFICHKFLVLTVRNGQNWCTFAVVIIKSKLGYHFWTTWYVRLYLHWHFDQCSF